MNGSLKHFRPRGRNRTVARHMDLKSPQMAISMLMDLLSKAATVAMLSFVVSSMLAMGAGLTVARIIEPLRNVRLVLFALVANFVLMPAGAVALAKALRLDEPFGVGMLLLGCAAGAPFLPKLAELAKGNLAFAVGVMVLLMVATVGYLPIVLPLLLPGVTVDPWQIARSLVLLMLLPLAAGLVLKSHYEDFAMEAKRVLDWISNVSLILLVFRTSPAASGSTVGYLPIVFPLLLPGVPAAQPCDAAIGRRGASKDRAGAPRPFDHHNHSRSLFACHRDDAARRRIAARCQLPRVGARPWGKRAGAAVRRQTRRQRPIAARAVT